MGASHHFTSSMLLVAILGVGAIAGGCTSSSHVVGPGPTTTSPSSGRQAGSSNPVLPAVVNCLKSQGVTVAQGANAKQIRATFVGLPLTKQATVFATCRASLPPRLRVRIQALITEEAATTTTTP